MAKDILVIIGARKVGKTEAVESLQRAGFGWAVASPSYWAIKDFCEVSDMTLDEFFLNPSSGDHVNFETHKRLMFLYKEEQERLDRDKYIRLFQEEIESHEKILVDDIYTFDELCYMIKLGAKVLLIDSDQKKRNEMGYIRGMDQEFYTREVATIVPATVKNWKHTAVVDNNGSLEKFKSMLREFVR